MNQERLLLYRALKKQGHIIHFLEEQGDFNYDLVQLVQSYSGKKITAIIFEEPIWSIKLNFNITFKNAHDVLQPKGTFLTDYWGHRREVRHIIRKNDIISVLSTHQTSFPFLLKYYKELRFFKFIPFCIDPDLFDFEVEKQYDIVNTGVLHPVTPFRARLVKLLEQSKDINYRTLEHPGKRITTKNAVVGQDYLKFLASSYFAIATTTAFNLSVRKYYEIMGVGSTVIGNATSLPEHNLVRQNFVELREDMSDQEILHRIRTAIKKKKEYNHMAKALKDKALSYASAHTVAKTIEQFYAEGTMTVFMMSKKDNIFCDHSLFVLFLDACARAICTRLRIPYKGILI